MKLVREGLKLIPDLNELRMECYILVNLALVTCKLSDYDEAEAIVLELLTLAEKLSMKDVMAKTLERLGRVAVARGHYPEAQHYLKESLKVAWAWAHQFSILDGLIRLSELFIDQGEAIKAAECLGLVRHQRGFLNEHKLEVERLLKLLREQVSEQELEKALQHGKKMKLEDIVPELLMRL